MMWKTFEWNFNWFRIFRKRLFYQKYCCQIILQWFTTNILHWASKINPHNVFNGFEALKILVVVITNCENLILLTFAQIYI